jgi:hypothetical protein
MKRIIGGALLLWAATIGSGCAYGGIATTADGSTVYIARNDLLFFGIARRIYACKVTNNQMQVPKQLDCKTMDGEP